MWSNVYYRNGKEVVWAIIILLNIKEISTLVYIWKSSSIFFSFKLNIVGVRDGIWRNEYNLNEELDYLMLSY